MAADQTSKYCSNCEKQTLWARPGTNHILHLLLTVLVCGFWLPVWVMASIRIGGWRCQTCGGKDRSLNHLVVPVICIALFLVFFTNVIDKFRDRSSKPEGKKSSIVSNEFRNNQQELEDPKPKTPAPGELVNDVSQLIPYEIIDRDASPPFKVSFDIRVNLVDGRLPTNRELEDISKYLRSDAEKYNKTFVLFYLPGMEVDSGAYATAHHTPRFDGVKVLTVSVPKEFQALIDPAANEKGPTHCSNLVQLAELYPGDFSDFEVISEIDIPHFEITCNTFSGDSRSRVDYEIKSSIVMAVGMTFVHTDYEAITVTVVPEELELSSRALTRRENQAVTLTVSRPDALSAFRGYAEMNSFEDLVGGMMDTTYLPDYISPRFADFLMDETKVVRLYRALSTRRKSNEVAAEWRRKMDEKLMKKSAKSAEEKQKAEQRQKREEEEEASRWRTWTDSTGKHTVEARFTGVALGKVILTRRDGKNIRLPLEKLSQPDQEWINARK